MHIKQTDGCHRTDARLLEILNSDQWLSVNVLHSLMFRRKTWCSSCSETGVSVKDLIYLFQPRIPIGTPLRCRWFQSDPRSRVICGNSCSQRMFTYRTVEGHPLKSEGCDIKRPPRKRLTQRRQPCSPAALGSRNSRGVCKRARWAADVAPAWRRAILNLSATLREGGYIGDFYPSDASLA